MRASIRAIKKRFKRFNTVGKRCRMYAAGCYRCEEYRRLLETGRFSHSFDEFWEYAMTHDPETPSITWQELAENPSYALKKGHD